MKPRLTALITDATVSRPDQLLSVTLIKANHSCETRAVAFFALRHEFCERLPPGAVHQRGDEIAIEQMAFSRHSDEKRTMIPATNCNWVDRAKDRR